MFRVTELMLVDLSDMGEFIAAVQNRFAAQHAESCFSSMQRSA